MDASSPVLAPGSPGEEFLTPRSKVAKMLADIDKEIDDAPSSPITRNTTSKPVDERSNEKLPSDSPDALFGDQDSALRSNEKDQEFGSDSDEDIRPQGRAARRMRGSLKSSPQPTAEMDLLHQDDDDELSPATPRRPNSESPSGDRGQDAGGLFVSPSKSTRDDDDEDDDLPVNPLGNKQKLADLVAQKRAERLAKEAEKEQGEQAASSDLPEGAYEEAEDTPVDRNVEKIMSDASRPTRKASKKALEDMERETQRLARQQALAHQMKVKKKFTTNDLFAKFNFRRQPPAVLQNEQPMEADATASSAPNSDGIEERPKDPHSTPPSSPPSPLDLQKSLVEKGALSKLVPTRQDSIASLAEADDEDDLPDIFEIMKGAQKKQTNGPPIAEPLPEEKKGLKLARLGKKAVTTFKDDSDDELEIIKQPPLPAHLRAFEKAAASDRVTRPADSKALHHLKHFANFNQDAPRKQKGSRPSVAPQALEAQLRKRAKEQARLQQLERIEELRAKGIEVQTSEEREKEAEAFENLLEKARQDAVELRKAEKAARKEAGEDVMEASEDEDEDDGDYVGSGSEEEEGEDGDDEREWDDTGLLDDAADETDEEADEEMGDEAEAEAEEDGLGIDEPGEVPTACHLEGNTVPIRKARASRVVKDDEDEDSDEGIVEPAQENVAVDDDPFAAFNFGAANSSALMSPTQAFKATMQTPTQDTQEDSFDILRRIAPPSATSLPPMPDFESQDDGDQQTQVSFVAGSQVPESQRISLNWETQAPETPAPAALNRGPSALSETPGWEPTQDNGIQSPWSVRPKARRESTVDSLADHETQSTVELRVSESPAPSQQGPKRGRLERKRVPLFDDSDEEAAPPPASVKPEKRDAFREMARRRREALTKDEKEAADKELRGMMEEQAEESEDEYAGLGGDDYVAPETEQDREMIDSSEINVDERALAAHFAERQRQRDEAETSKLYKDLTTGVLRRKMGANSFDLDEDEDELATRRRQMRQQEEARKRRALLKDENIATLAEGKNSKGRDAFLKAIADDDGDEEMAGLSDREDETVPATQEDNTQSQSQQQEGPNTAPLREISGNKRKSADDQTDRAPAKARRTQASAFRRPTSMLEVQESVSFLLEEPNAGAPVGPTVLELSSDSENEETQGSDQLEDGDEEDEVAAENARQNNGGFAPNPASMEASKIMPPPRLPASQRRTAPKAAVVDRLSLKRGSSTSSTSSTGRSAWASNSTSGGGFKPPSLLRRATTSSLSSGSGSDRGVTTSAGGGSGLGRDTGVVKMGGSKKSSLAYQARAEERRAIVEASAERRRENTRRIAEMRGKRSELGKGLGGSFE